MSSIAAMNNTNSSSKLTARSNSAQLDLNHYPYLHRLEKLQHAYPALKSLLNKLKNNLDEGRKLVANRYSTSGLHGGSPGRCAIITFDGDNVSHKVYDTAEELRSYFAEASGDCAKLNGEDKASAENGTSKPRRRLFILEDMEPSMVDLLGQVSSEAVAPRW